MVGGRRSHVQPDAQHLLKMRSNRGRRLAGWRPLFIHTSVSPSAKGDRPSGQLLPRLNLVSFTVPFQEPSNGPAASAEVANRTIPSARPTRYLIGTASSKMFGAPTGAMMEYGE